MSSELVLPKWAALELQNVELPTELTFERAVWGKAHGTAGDYRWIAASPKFAASATLPAELGLGSEDKPVSGYAWRNLGGETCAVHFYPSRARDAAGRGGFLEKQVLSWRPPTGVPALLGALLLLHKAADTGDEVWWPRSAEPRLHDSGFRLDLPVESPISITAPFLIELLEAGRRLLLERVSEAALAELYAGLLAGARGIPLQPSSPLPPSALAALLLPLPRALAEKISLVSQLPSNRFSSQDLAQRWTIIASDDPSGLSPGGPIPSASQKMEGIQLAAAVSAGKPPAVSVPGIAPETPVTPSPGPEVQIALWGPAAAGKTVLLAQLYLGRGESPKSSGWETFPTEKSLQFGSQMRELVTRNSRFPTATVASLTERLDYLFHQPQTGNRATLIVEDRAGKHSEKLDDHARDRLRQAQGLVLIFDHRRDVTQFQTEIEQTLDEVHLARRGGVDRDRRPIAACISKADLLIETAEDALFASQHPDRFVREKVAAVERLVAALDRFCSNYQLFPVSAAGLRLRHGAIEPTVFYDENLQLRLRSQSRSFNLMAPFAWVLNQVSLP